LKERKSKDGEGGNKTKKRCLKNGQNKQNSKQHLFESEKLENEKK